MIPDLIQLNQNVFTTKSWEKNKPTITLSGVVGCGLGVIKPKSRKWWQSKEGFGTFRPIT